MPNALGKPGLLAELKSEAAALGLSAREDGKDKLSGEIESIRAKWFLGSRKAIYRMSCRLAEAEHMVLFREAVTEKSWGLPPPAFTVEKTTTTGWKRSGTRTDVSVGGGGSIDYARVRNAMEQAAIGAGWEFRLEGGRLP
jgi:hypothetical protein